MRMNFIGNSGVGYSGEVADELHIVRELKSIGVLVNFIPRDTWKVAVDSDNFSKLPGESLEADINIICKWSHFNDGKYVNILREVSGAPVFYWVWDFLFDPTEVTNFNLEMAKAADLYLTGEGGLIPEYKKLGIDAYYFQFDAHDFQLAPHPRGNFKHDLVFTGSLVRSGNRLPYLKEINHHHPVKIYAPDYSAWRAEGFDADPAVYEDAFQRIVAESKICLGFSVTTTPCWGYWSNRIGKVIGAGGFLLYEYQEGMELLLPPSIEYFSSPKEAINKIDYYLDNESIRETAAAYNLSKKEEFSSLRRASQLYILIDRFLEDHGRSR